MSFAIQVSGGEMKPVSEDFVRMLRDKVYGQTSTDNNWEHAKGWWMNPEEIAWLMIHINPTRHKSDVE